MSQIPLWFERKFEFAFPASHFPNLCVRLRGTPARIEEMVRGAAVERLIEKPDGKWSAQEHAGHLGDLEMLWLARVEDFLTEGDTLTEADLTNRKTEEARHNERPISEVLAKFRAARMRLEERLAGFDAKRFAHTKLHPRLRQPMRLVDHLYFVAEHDDHHLARIWEMIGRSA